MPPNVFDIPVARRFSISVPWILLCLIGTVGLFVLAGRLLDRSSFTLSLLKFGVVVVGSILGITVTWSRGRRGLIDSALGGALGCGIAIGSCAFFTTLLIPPPPGERYKWGQGIDAAIFTFLLAGGLGGLCFGTPIGLLAGFAWFLRTRSGGKDFVLLSILYPEDRGGEADCEKDDAWPDRGS